MSNTPENVNDHSGVEQNNSISDNYPQIFHHEIEMDQEMETDQDIVIDQVIEIVREMEIDQEIVHDQVTEFDCSVDDHVAENSAMNSGEEQNCTNSLEEIDELPPYDEAVGEAALETSMTVEAEPNEIYVEYGTNILASMHAAEKKFRIKSSFLTIQVFLTPQMRTNAIAWMFKTCDNMSFNTETAHLSTIIFDRFAARQMIEKSEVHLAGLVALLLGSKMEEYASLTIDDIRALSASAYTDEEIIKYEMKMLKALKFRLMIPTPYTFLSTFHEALQSTAKVQFMSRYCIDLAVSLGSQFHIYLPSQLATAALIVAHANCGIEPLSIKFCTITHCKVDDVADLVTQLASAQKLSYLKKLGYIYRLYSSDKFMRIAESTPIRIDINVYYSYVSRLTDERNSVHSQSIDSDSVSQTSQKVT